MDHLVGTPALKPYMHGYFVSLQLYDAARVIANPYAYAEHRERMVQDKMDKLAETRIRSRKDGAGNVKVNKALAEKIKRDEERAKKREERKAAKKAKAHAAADEAGAVEGEGEGEDAMEVDDEGAGGEGTTSLLSDPRFAAVFQDPEFQVDQSSREFALLNPSSATQRQTRDAGRPRGKTAVEEEEEESDKASSDPLSESDETEGGKSGSESEDSDDAGSKCYIPPFSLSLFTVNSRSSSQSSGRTTSAHAWRRAPRSGTASASLPCGAIPKCGLCPCKRRIPPEAAAPWTRTRRSASVVRCSARQRARSGRETPAGRTCGTRRTAGWR